MKNSPPARSQPKELAELAYESIREKILRGQLTFGSEISRRETAKELGISILPVTVALQRLENEHLVESIRRVGTRVRIPTAGDIRGFYVVREAIESQAARLLADRADSRDLRQLQKMADDLDLLESQTTRCPEPSDEQLFQLRNRHMAFHLRLAEMSGCPALCDLLARNQILTFNWFYDHLFGRRPLPSRWHGTVVEVISKGDPELADRAMRTHVRYRMDEVLARLEPFFQLDRAGVSALVTNVL